LKVGVALLAQADLSATPMAMPATVNFNLAATPETTLSLIHDCPSLKGRKFCPRGTCQFRTDNPGFTDRYDYFFHQSTLLINKKSP
jgi:hypothetical protein